MNKLIGLIIVLAILSYAGFIKINGTKVREAATKTAVSVGKASVNVAKSVASEIAKPAE